MDTAIRAKNESMVKTRIILEYARKSGKARAMLYTALKGIDNLSDATDKVHKNMGLLKDSLDRGENTKYIQKLNVGLPEVEWDET